MRIVLDTAILVRATESSRGVARGILLDIVNNKHTLLVSNQILVELAKVLRYPRMQALLGLPEPRVYDFVRFLHGVGEMVILDPTLNVPIRDVTDIAVVQTAIIGHADLICTIDNDFYEPVITRFLNQLGIEVVADATLAHRLRFIT